MSIPAFGLGTFRLQGLVVIDSVSTGLELGYRVIDTAQIYETTNTRRESQLDLDYCLSRDQWDKGMWIAARGPKRPVLVHLR